MSRMALELVVLSAILVPPARHSVCNGLPGDDMHGCMHAGWVERVASSLYQNGLSIFSVSD
jgi:hypothetical protein